MIEGMIWLTGSVVALSVGSFITVMAYRLPQRILDPYSTLTLSLPRSHCPACKTPLRLRDNIPLLSWIWLRGKCHACQQPISWRYPTAEASTLIISLLLANGLPHNMMLLFSLLLCWSLLALSLIDIEYQLLPDALTLPLLWLGLLLHAFDQLAGSLTDAVFGAALGYALLWILATGYRCLRGVEALGMGDAKLLAALGAWLGWQMLPLVLLISATSGLCYAITAKLIFKRLLGQTIPLGPWLSLAGACLHLREVI